MGLPDSLGNIFCDRNLYSEFSQEKHQKGSGKAGWRKIEIELWNCGNRASCDPPKSFEAGVALQRYLELRQVNQTFVPLN